MRVTREGCCLTLMGRWVVACVLAMTCSLAWAAPQPLKGPYLWGRHDIKKGYVLADAISPLQLVILNDEAATSQPLRLRITFQGPATIHHVVQRASWPHTPQPLVVPTEMSNAPIPGGMAYEMTIPPQAAKPRPGMVYLLVHVQGEPTAPITMTAELRTADGAVTWPTMNWPLEVLPRLQGQAPVRSLLGAADYPCPADATLAEAYGQLATASGMNHLGLMLIPPQAWQDPAVVGIHERGGRIAAIVHQFQLVRDALKSRHPQVVLARKPGEQALADYDWVINHPDETHEALVNQLRGMGVDKMGMFYNDIEERPMSYGQQGELVHATESALQAFRKQFGIDPSVKLDTAVIQERYASQWIDFRATQIAQVNLMVRDACLKVNPDIRFGVYSGLYFTGAMKDHTKRQYSLDWDLIVKQPMDFISAGYNLNVSLYQSTAQAGGSIPFHPGLMYITNFAQDQPLPDSDQWFSRLMQAYVYSGGRGMFTWYLRVMDASAFSGVDRAATVIRAIEDLLWMGQRVDQQVASHSPLPENSLFAYSYQDRRLIVLFNPSNTEPLNYHLAWRTALPKGVAMELTRRRWLPQGDAWQGVVEPGGQHIIYQFSDMN